MLGVFIGGTETVPKIVAHGLWELGLRPDQMAAVRADLDANVPMAREEMIRYCAPAQWFARTLRKPFTIHDTTIEPGQRIITLLASANRDEREYADPDEFIWDRPIERLLAFGRGQHFCLGVHLARLEIAIMVTEWLKRVPDYRIVERGRVAAAVEFPMGLEQHPGGGLRCGRIGWSRRTPSSEPTFRRRRRSRWATVRCSLRFLAAGVCGSDLPGFRGAKGRLPGDTGASAAEMDGFPIHEVVGEVIASRHRSHGIGDRVVGWASGFDGLMEHVVADGDGLAPFDPALTPQHAVGAATAGVRALRARAASEAARVATSRSSARARSACCSPMRPRRRAPRHVTGVDPVDRDGIAKEFGVDTVVRATSDRWVSHLDAARPSPTS